MWVSHIFHLCLCTSATFPHSAEIAQWPPGSKSGKYPRQYYAFRCSFSPLSPCAFCLTHSISLPFMLRRVCCWPSSSNLGERTHRAAGVYSTATPVKNTLLWKYSHSVHSKTLWKIRLVQNKFKFKHKYRNSWRIPGLLQFCLPEVWISK